MNKVATIVTLGSATAFFAHLASQSSDSNQQATQTSILPDDIDYDVEMRFIQYLSLQGKSYATKEEFEYRLSIFAAADKVINEANSENGVFTLGHNKFSDMNEHEKSKFRGKKYHNHAHHDNEHEHDMVHNHHHHEEEQLFEDIQVDESVDWRNKGPVNPVKDQGSCGSCWTFSGIGAIEAAHYFATGELVSLSEQQIVDCQTLDEGCNGGEERDAIAFGKNNGICTEKEYPYQAKTHKCQQQSCEGGPQISKIHDVYPRSQIKLQEALMQSPTTLAVDADCDFFMYYTSGILTKSCGTSLDHAVMAVGYGTEGGQDYWIVRNSWGPDWGEEGYIRIAAEKTGKGICGSQMESHWAEGAQ